MANENKVVEWAMQAEQEEAEQQQQQQQNHAYFSQVAALVPPPPCGEASCTLDDFINSINFESMDQFLDSIEDIHPPPNNFSTTTAASVAAQLPVFIQPESENVHQPPMILQREEESLVSSMPVSLYQKTWAEILNGETGNQHHLELELEQEQNQTTNLHIPPPQPQVQVQVQVLQEKDEWIYLKDYLIEAGVSIPRELSHPPPPYTPPQTFPPLCSFPSSNSVEIEDLELAIANAERHFETAFNARDGGNYTFTNQQQLNIYVPMEATMMVVAGENQDKEMDMGGRKRRRIKKTGIHEDVTMDEASNDSDKMLKRMIKNRESAARSRARRQAYIAELEEKIEQYKAENYRLKQDLAEMEVQNAKVLDKRSCGKVRKLLRSSSS